MHRDAAGVVAPVLQTLQALNEDGDDVALTDGADDATHGCESPWKGRRSGSNPLKQKLAAMVRTDP
jgi:hypothetical protein